MSLIRSHTLALLLIVGLACALPSSASDPGTVPGAVPLPGQRATLLPDGRWLMTGGESAAGSLPTAWVWDPRTGALAELPAGMLYARAWHSATVLPDGSVLIAGGRGPWSSSPRCSIPRP